MSQQVVFGNSEAADGMSDEADEANDGIAVPSDETADPRAGIALIGTAATLRSIPMYASTRGWLP